MFGKMKEMYELQKKARNLQKDLKKMLIEEEHKGIRVVVNGTTEIQSIEFDPEITENLSDEKLGKFIMEAVNSAQKTAQKKAAKQMGDITGGMLPGM